MRNLTIKRQKSFVACLGKMKIYIEAPTSGDLTINDIPCRKLGELKNGEEKTFQIEDHAAKLFVIADKLSKNYCNDYYQLSEGSEDIFLSGKNKYNPFNGNAFRFDNNESEESVANRKRGTRKGMPILIVAVLVGVIIGFSFSSGLLSSKKNDAKTFSYDEISITLTNEFERVELENGKIAYSSDKIAVLAQKDPFALTEDLDSITTEQYAEISIQANGLPAGKVKTVGGLVCFEYDFTNYETGKTYRYFSYAYKTDDAFWLVQFAALKIDADNYADEIAEWAKSVEFSK